MKAHSKLLHGFFLEGRLAATLALALLAAACATMTDKEEKAGNMTAGKEQAGKETAENEPAGKEPAAIEPAPKASAAEQTADLVFLDGHILTLDPDRPEAEALAIRGDRIAAVGGNAAIEKMIGETTRVINLHGRTATPGLIESHAHLLGMGLARMRLDLTGTKSEAEIAAMVKSRTTSLPPGRWILGRGWDQNDWANKAFPTSRSLTAAAPDNPVCLTRIDGHAVWVNEKALAIAGITAETPDPPGGRIVRDAIGAPAGVFVDNAVDLVRSRIPEPTRAEKKKALLLAMKESNAFGLTSFHDAGENGEVIAIYREILGEGRLTLRMNVMLAGDDAPLLDEFFARGPVIGSGHHFLTIRCVKLYADGALGSRGAALLEDYADDPGNRGLVIEPEERIFSVACRALEHGFQVGTHAIGDRANRTVLNAYERAFKAHPEVADPRFRIEHAQILDAADIPRFASLKVIAAMQPTHCTSDMPWVHARIGAARAAEGAYAWRKLLDEHVHVPGGSDAPVESANPFLGIYAAVTRQDLEGNPPGGWYPEERMTRREALRAYTVEGAYASFEEGIKGRLKPGMLADLTVIDRDIMTVPAAKIPGIKVIMTVVGGRIVYEAKD